MALCYQDGLCLNMSTSEANNVFIWVWADMTCTSSIVDNYAETWHKSYQLDGEAHSYLLGGVLFGFWAGGIVMEPNGRIN
jgi:hypothetical protein